MEREPYPTPPAEKPMKTMRLDKCPIRRRGHVRQFAPCRRNQAWSPVASIARIRARHRAKDDNSFRGSRCGRLFRLFDFLRACCIPVLFQRSDIFRTASGSRAPWIVIFEAASSISRRSSGVSSMRGCA